MPTVLGIGNPAHNTGAAVVRDGAVVDAVNESRLSRVKRESRFPTAAINAVLDEADGPIDRIALTGIASPYPFRRFRVIWRHRDGVGEAADAALRAAYRSIGDPEEAVLRSAAERLAAETALDGDVTDLADRMAYVDHHRAHAAAAYYTSGFDRATVLTVDAAGDEFATTVYRGEDGELSRVAATDHVDSLGHPWSQLPTVFGFKGGKHAGKFMGMASYVQQPPAELTALFEELLRVDGLAVINRFEREHRGASYERKIEAWRDRVGEYDAAAVARALQDRTKDIVETLAAEAIERTGLPDLAVAGGVLANVQVNQRLYQHPRVARFFVHQHMGDGGLGLGAALDRYAAGWGYEPTLLDDVALGPAAADGDIESALNRIDLPADATVDRHDDETTVAARAADVLADGGVVALYTGRVEYGPRALGQRSILYRPDDPSAIEWLNERLDRTEFMPFAPVTLRRRAEECYEGYDPETCPAASFMTLSFDCTDTMRERSPGVVHVDGTARPQVLDRETNPLYHAILEAYEDRTGLPTLINTSFNMHGEPIVVKPTEALRSFLRTGNEALVMEHTVVERGES